MTRSTSFVMKQDLELSGPVTLRVMSISWTYHRLGDPHPLNLMTAIGKVGKKQKLEHYTPELLIESWLEIFVGALDCQGLLWGDDGVAVPEPQPQKSAFRLSRLKDAQRKNSVVTFLYRKPDDRLVLDQGIPRKVDSERDLLTLETEGVSHSRSFLISEILGLYKYSGNNYTWKFVFEPLPRGRTNVSVTFEDNFKRSAKRRKSRVNPVPREKSLPTKPDSIVKLLAAEENSQGLLGELFELITPTGERLGLRVEYVKPSKDA